MNRCLRLALLSSAISLAVFAQETTADSPFLEKPYLQLGNSPALSNPEKLVLMWHTVKTGDWSVEVRTAPDADWRATKAPAAARIHAPGIDEHFVYRAQLDGLVPGSEFRYRVSLSGKPVFEAASRARKSAGQPQHFVVFGDVAQGTPGQKAVAVQVAQTKPDFIFVAGDIVYTAGRISEYRTKFFPIYNADETSPETGAPLLRSIPFVAAPGNHDTAFKNFERFPDSLAYFYYWDMPLNGPTLKGEKQSHTLAVNPDANAAPAFLDAAKQRYPVMANFSFDYGNAHWTILDSNPYMDWSDPALQAWVKADIASAPNATWHFVGFHHPGFNSSKSHLTDQWMRFLSPVFEAAKVDVVFAGHVHNYQRTFPLTFVPKKQADGSAQGPKGEVAGDWTLDKAFGDGGKSKPKGVIYIITGGGGASLYNPEQEGDQSTWQPFTNKYFAGKNSFSVVDIDGGSFRFRQLSASGEEIDSFQLSK